MREREENSPTSPLFSDNNISCVHNMGKISTILQVAFFSFLLAFILLEFAGLVTVAIVITSSMEPFLPKGSVGLFVKAGKYGVGDVIVFRVHGCLVAHRIVAESESGFRTKGDYNGVLDPWVVTENAILGKLVLPLPMLGYIAHFLRSPLIFAIVSTLIFMDFTWRSFFPKETVSQSPPLRHNHTCDL